MHQHIAGTGERLRRSRASETPSGAEPVEGTTIYSNYDTHAPVSAEVRHHTIFATMNSEFIRDVMRSSRTGSGTHGDEKSQSEPERQGNSGASMRVLYLGQCCS